LTALYVKIDDQIAGVRCLGRPPKLSDSELICLAVAQALLGHRSEARWLRYARKHLSGMFPYLPKRSGYHKRLRAALPLVKRMIRELARDSDFWWDKPWITDSTPGALVTAVLLPLLLLGDHANSSEIAWVVGSSAVLLAAVAVDGQLRRRGLRS